VLGLAAALFFQRYLGVPDGLIFALIVVVCARYLGTGPALMASALSIIAIDITMLPPIGSVEFTHPETIAHLSVFLVLSLVINGATHSLKTAREHADALAQRTAQLLEVTTSLAKAELPRDVARVAVEQGSGVVGANVGVVAALTEGRVEVLDWGQWPADRAKAAQQLLVSGDGPLDEAMRSRRLVWVASRDELKARYPDVFDRDFYDVPAVAFLALPLMQGGHAIGGMLLGFPDKAALGADDHAYPRLLAHSVSNALVRARTFERERHDRHEAESLARTREEVLGVVAHDLRNPLGVAGSVLQLVAEPGLGSEQRDTLLATGTRAVRQMNRLIGDLLDVIRMETGHLALETDDVAAATIVHHAEEGVRHAAMEKGIALVCNEPDASIHLRADRERIAQVMSNLLGNAIKFTPKGGRVSVRAWRDGADVVFEVADTGPGVAPENQAHLFERFWQARRADQRGVGLGLAIAKGIVEAHGGRIWMLSTVGKGSRFLFSIPASQDVAASPARAS
jgi:K+-sensing histidine kinase KdpD